jgi:hypothetical protein
VAEGISSLNLREKRTIPESNFNLARVNLTHTLGTSNDCSEATVCLSFWLVEQGHHKWLSDHTHTNCARRMSVARLHDHTHVRLCETYAYSVRDCRTYSHPLRNVLPHFSACVKNQITSCWRYVHSSGRSVTRLTAYHISQHVASTFKRLATTTTHCDLIKFSSTRTG